MEAAPPPVAEAASVSPAAVATAPVEAASQVVGDTLRVIARDSGALSGPVTVASMAAADASAVPEAAPAPAPIVWDLEVEGNATRKRVTYFADIFAGRVRPSFERALSRQTRFSGMISERLAAAGLPLDLTYLALIESWYDPHAYSKASAVGMWQFMPRTAKAVGLRVDWWIDERRDPIRSTEGAIRHLSSLHDDFGSFFLAAAAYNGGSSRVNRGLTRFASRIDDVEGEDRFFALSDTRYLRPETRDYVPKMIAAALVAKQPARFGLRIDSLAPFAFDSVWVPGGTSLAAIAAAAPTDVETIRDLNSHVLRGLLPAGYKPWTRVPVGTAEGFDERLAALDSTMLVATKRVVSKKGESMASIARKHQLTAKQLAWYNPKIARLKSGNLVTGQTITVPTPAVVEAARDVPNPASERYPRRARARPAATKSAVKAPAKAAAKSPAKSPAKASSKR